MSNYENEIKKYEGKGIPHRGLNDDVKKIVLIILAHLPKNNLFLNSYLSRELSIYIFIEKIEIKDNCCVIDYVDNGNIKKIKFSSLYFGDDYKNMCYEYEELIEKGYTDKQAKKLSGEYRLSNECHSSTLEYLEEHKDDNICAVTSISVSFKNLLFFHSYIWNKDNNMIYDFSRNICMNKDTYDCLFTHKEINALDYTEYSKRINDSEYTGDTYYQLLYLALDTLLKEKSNEKKDSSPNKKNKVNILKKLFNT